MFLTQDELKELCDCKNRKAIIEWLDKNGFEFAMSRLGNPKVLRSYVEARFGYKIEQKSTNEPNFDIFNVA